MDDNLPKLGSKYELKLWPEDYGMRQVLFLLREDDDGKHYVGTISWKEIDPMNCLVPDDALLMRRTGQDSISAMMIKALADAGEFRKATDAENATLRGWLEDMRKLVFSGQRHD